MMILFKKAFDYKLFTGISKEYLTDHDSYRMYYYTTIAMALLIIYVSGP